MKKPDKTDRQILGEIIKDPRISDNGIARKTSIPVKTVNRKRKILESEGIVSYYAAIDNFQTGTFKARYMFEIRFRLGISRQYFEERFSSMPMRQFEAKHICHAMLGEESGHLQLVLIIESRDDNDMLEIYNSELVPRINEHFGHDIIHSTRVVRLTKTLRLHHNYLPGKNIKDCRIKDDWPDENLFVCE